MINIKQIKLINKQKICYKYTKNSNFGKRIYKIKKNIYFIKLNKVS